MLIDKDFTLTNNLAETLAEKSVTLSPVNNTPLAELCRLSINPWFLDFTPIFANNNVTQYTEHDILQDKMIDLLSKSVTQQVSFIRTEIVPEIDNIYMEVKNHINSSMNRNPESDINLVQIDRPQILDTSLFLSDIESRFKGATTTPPILDAYPSDTSSEVIEQVRESIKNYYQGDRSGSFEYASTLTNDQIIHALVNYGNNTTDNHERLAGAVNGYILTQVLKSDDELASQIYGNKSANSLRDFLKSLETYYGPTILALKDHLEKVSSGGPNSLLILRVDDAANTMYVNGPIYRQWITNGGDNRVLYGILADPEVSPLNFTISSIDASKEKYIKYWEKYLVLEQAKQTVNTLNYFREYMRVVFFTRLSGNKAPFEKEYEEITPGSLEAIKDRFATMLSHVTVSNLVTDKDLYDTIMEIVCKSRYYYTDAYRILNYMVAESKSGTENDSSSLAMLAVVYYLVDYFIEQINVIPG